MTTEERTVAKRRYVVGAVLTAGLIAALIGFAQADGARKAEHGQRDPTALESVRSPGG